MSNYDQRERGIYAIHANAENKMGISKFEKLRVARVMNFENALVALAGTEKKQLTTLGRSKNKLGTTLSPKKIKVEVYLYNCFVEIIAPVVRKDTNFNLIFHCRITNDIF